MRTLLLVGAAAVAAISATPGHAHGSQSVQRRVVVVHPNGADDAAVYSSDADRAPTEGDYRGRWQGEWNGTWEDAQGRRYNGTYEGSYDAGNEGARSEHAEHYRGGAGSYRSPPPPAGYDGPIEDCERTGNGVGGAIVGGAVGGLAGNRIAGRGNRTAGTIVGAGVGAVAGAALDRATNRNCVVRGQGRGGDARYHDEARHEGGRHPHHGQPAPDGPYGRGYYGDGAGYSGYDSYSSYYAGGGDYYGGGQVIVIPGQPVIIEETETTYETVVTPAPRVRAVPRARVHHRRPVRRPAPRCTCR